MSESHPSSPPSKRIKLEPPPSPPPGRLQDIEDARANDDPEEEHCTICLQPFIDRTIIPTCAHEFCFECILLWSEQSRKCPLCARSFDNSYLIHRIRSDYDYQKHHLPPLRTSPPLLTDHSRAQALRNTRRERQWGRRERQRREEEDQLETAISRRRWIYQHNLYGKHIASNPYTRYRPFPTPAEFAASPNLISRMAIFLRRELRVWPNLDVEFLTTYTISLMKSIDIRSESAVKLLSEFLDLDTPYSEGARHMNAEHFAHEIYSYLRSPYRDLTTYDQIAQYDTPSEIPQPQEIERGSRWNQELPPRSESHSSPPSQSRSRSNSRYRSPIPQRENRPRYLPSAEHPRNTSAEARCEGRSSRRHARSRSPRNTRPGRREHVPISIQHGPRDGVQDHLRNSSPSSPEASSSATPTEHQVTRLPTPFHFPEDKKGKGKATTNFAERVHEASTPKMSEPQGDDSAAISSSHSTGIIRPAVETLRVSTDGGADHVDKVPCGSSASNFASSRKRSAQLGDTLVRPPRNRTLSESIQAHLSRPTRHLTGSAKEGSTLSGDSQPAHPLDVTKKLPNNMPTLLRLSDAPTQLDFGNLDSSRKTNVEMPPSHPTLHSAKARDNTSCDLQPSQFLDRRSSTTPIKLDERSDGLIACPTQSALPSREDVTVSVDRSPDLREFPPSKASTVGVGAPHATVQVHVSASSSSPTSSSAAPSSELIRSQRSGSPQSPPPHTEVNLHNDHLGRPGIRNTTTSADDRRSLLLRRLEEEQRWATTPGGHTGASGSEEPRKTDTPAPFSDVSRDACEDAPQDGRGLHGVGEVAGIGVIEPSPTSIPFSNANAPGDVSDLESRLRTRALIRVRLAAMKSTVREASDPAVIQYHDEAGEAGKSGLSSISGEREEALRGFLRERRT